MCRCVEPSPIFAELWEILHKYAQKVGFLTHLKKKKKGRCYRKHILSALTIALWFGEEVQNRKEKRQRDASKLHSGELHLCADDFF